jgi:hypothetical protein
MTVLLNLIDLFEDKISKLRAFRSGERANIELGNFKDGFTKSVKLVCGGVTVLKYGIAAPEAALQALKAELATRADIVGVKLDRNGLTIEVEPVLVDEELVNAPKLPELPKVGIDFAVPQSIYIAPTELPSADTGLGLPPNVEDLDGDLPTIDPDVLGTPVAEIVDAGLPPMQLPELSNGLINKTVISDGLTTIGLTGVDAEATYGAVVDKGLTKGVLVKKGAYLFFDTINIGNGRAKAIENLAANPELFGQINGLLI